MEVTLRLPPGPGRVAITGPAERNLKLVREALGVRVQCRDDAMRLTGDSDAVGRAARVFESLSRAAERGEALSRQEVLEAVAASSSADPASPASVSSDRAPLGDDLDVYLTGKRVRPATDGQRAYLRAILDHDLTLCCGPAGTGKTYLAVAAAVAMLRRGMVRKLVLVRPAVEAGEKLGFLPGTMQDKVNPYLRPLLDALHDMMPFEQIERFMACDLIEIVPLAFMRGRTLNDAVILLDEAQNTTRSQMLMFLTRLGHGGKMVVTGDTSQIDLDDPRDSGLVDAVRRLRRVVGVASVALDAHDIVRHSLVQRIIAMYEGDTPRRADASVQRPRETPPLPPPTTPAPPSV